MECTYAVAALSRNSSSTPSKATVTNSPSPGDIRVSTRVGFDPESPAEDVWKSLMATGELEDVATVREAQPGVSSGLL